ncbi:hypothetical protein Nepgr_000290 [Nepenthes gracilis]|uniref:Uncharacterized protein n=1 Tax=Nepenthes gracilis TaxID=150966 RepID=A0AAD3P2W6_NEPGR|nr:hypothetical protein Nepgr_000290 [Nepenthes gracilis]
MTTESNPCQAVQKLCRARIYNPTIEYLSKPKLRKSSKTICPGFVFLLRSRASSLRRFTAPRASAFSCSALRSHRRSVPDPFRLLVVFALSYTIYVYACKYV